MNHPWDDIYEALGISPRSAGGNEASGMGIRLPEGDAGLDRQSNREKKIAYNAILENVLLEQRENFHEADVLMGEVPYKVLPYFPGTYDFRRRVNAFARLYGGVKNSNDGKKGCKKLTTLEPIVSMEIFADQLIESVWKKGGRFLCLNEKTVESAHPGVHIMHMHTTRQMVLKALTDEPANYQRRISRRRMLQEKHGNRRKKVKLAIKAASGGSTKAKASETQPKSAKDVPRGRSKSRSRSVPSYRRFASQKREDELSFRQSSLQKPPTIDAKLHAQVR